MARLEYLVTAIRIGLADGDSGQVVMDNLREMASRL